MGIHRKLIGDGELNGRGVVIAEENGRTAMTHEAKTLIRISSVPDSVAQTNDFVHALSVDDFESAL